MNITLNVNFNNPTLVKIMATLEENVVLLQETAAIIAENTNLISSIKTITEKVFGEVEKLVADAGANSAELDAGIATLKEATLLQTAELTAAATKATAIDGLVPDITVV